MGWIWERASGEIEHLQENFEVIAEDAEHVVTLYESYARPGAFVDSKRTRVRSRGIRMHGKITYESLDDAQDGIAWLKWLFSGGVGKFYPRVDKARYIEAVRLSFVPTSQNGLLWEIDAEFSAPNPFWYDSALQVASLHIAVGNLSTTQMVSVGGGWSVWPKITVKAVGASVTNPKLALADGRFVQYTGVLAAGDVLTLDPDALTAKVGSTDALDKINLGWFDPTDRFYLDPKNLSVTFSAAAIGSGGSCVATLGWRRRWL